MNVANLQEANAALDAIDVRKSEFSAALARAGSELAAAESNLGSAILDGDMNATGKVANLRLQCDGLNAALSVLEQRRAVAMVEQRRATAADLRRQAEEKRNALRDLERKTAKHLAMLSDLEQVTFDRGILAAQRNVEGDWHPSVFASTRDLKYLSPIEYYKDQDFKQPYLVPRSRRLFDEAVELDRQAEAIEHELNPPAPQPEPPSALYEPPPAPAHEYGGDSWRRG